MSSHLYNLICIHSTYILPQINAFDMQISCTNIVFIIIRPVCKQQQVICVEVTVKEQHVTEDILEHKFDSHFFLQIHYAVLRQFFLDKFYLTLILSEIEGSKGTNSKNVYLFYFFRLVCSVYPVLQQNTTYMFYRLLFRRYDETVHNSVFYFLSDFKVLFVLLPYETPSCFSKI